MADIDIADPGASAAALKAALTAAIEPVTLTEPLTSNYVLAEVIGAVIVNAGTGGTPGPATVTTTTGTGTPAQFEVVIGAGGDIESITYPPLAPGSFTIPPADPTEEPVTGGGLTGATLALGLTFSPVVVSSNPARGLSLDGGGFPGFTTEEFDVVADGDIGSLSGYGGKGLQITSKGGYEATLYLRPAAGNVGGTRNELAGVGPHEGGITNTPGNIFVRADGVVGKPLHVVEGTIIGFDYYVSFYNDDGSTWLGASDIVSAAGEWGAFTPTRRALSTVAIGSDSNLERIVMEGDGHIYFPNSGLVAGTPAGAAPAPGRIDAETLFLNNVEVTEQGSGSATAVAGAATLNEGSGIITTESLVAQTSYTLTLTNNKIVPTSTVQPTVSNASGGVAPPTIRSITEDDGFVVIVFAMVALTGTFQVRFSVFN